MNREETSQQSVFFIGGVGFGEVGYLAMTGIKLNVKFDGNVVGME